MLPFRILSIDFDYFQLASREIFINYYPDGLDLPTLLSTIVWGTHYSSNPNLIKQVRINKTKLAQIIKILKLQRKDTPVLITQSHIDIYDFIHEKANNNKIKLINVDMHHDMFENNIEDGIIDCGNWLYYIDKEYDADITWIGNRTSSSLFFTDKNIKCIKNLGYANGKIFDAIFICRSDNWTATHLDEYFDNLIHECINHFDKCIIENSVSQPRNYIEMMKLENEVQKFALEKGFLN